MIAKGLKIKTGIDYLQYQIIMKLDVLAKEFYFSKFTAYATFFKILQLAYDRLKLYMIFNAIKVNF